MAVTMAGAVEILPSLEAESIASLGGINQSVPKRQSTGVAASIDGFCFAAPAYDFQQKSELFAVTTISINAA